MKNFYRERRTAKPERRIGNSQRETQTSNEELIRVKPGIVRAQWTVNLSGYMQNPLYTIREPLIILNKNLQIRSANNHFTQNWKPARKLQRASIFYSGWPINYGNSRTARNDGKSASWKASIVDYEVTLNLPAVGETDHVIKASTIFRDTVRNNWSFSYRGYYRKKKDRQCIAFVFGRIGKAGAKEPFRCMSECRTPALK